MKIIEVVNLTKRISNKMVLNHFEMSLNAGETVVLLGPSGSGKTTLLECILENEKYDRGEIELFNKKISQEKSLKNKIGLIPQESAFFYEFSVAENLAFFCQLYIHDKNKCKENVDDVLQLTGLESIKDRQAAKLDKNQQKLLNIACGIVHKPEVILFDEPFLGLDMENKKQVIHLIKQFKQRKQAVLCTSSIADNIEQICDRIIIINQGNLIAEGTQKQLRGMVTEKEKIFFEVSLLTEEDIKNLSALPGVLDSHYEAEKITFTVNSKNKSLFQIMDYFEQAEIYYSNPEIQESSLSEILFELTGISIKEG